MTKELESNLINEEVISKRHNIDLDLLLGKKLKLKINDNNNYTFSAELKEFSANEISVGVDEKQFSPMLFSNSDLINALLLRYKRRLARATWLTLRRTAMLLTNSVLRKPLLRIIKPSFLFAAYGDERDVGAYMTPFSLRVTPPLILAGIIKIGKRRGLLIAPKYYEKELEASSDKVRRYMSQIQNEFSKIKTIALVGRLPNFVMKAGLDLEPPYVDGSVGTRFMLFETAKKMKAMDRYQNETSIAVLGGAGRIGNQVVEDISTIYSNVVAFDNRYESDNIIETPNGRILYTSDVTKLENVKLYICLTSRGEVIEEFMDHFPEGSFIADDTHPSISLAIRSKLKRRNTEVLKTVIMHDEFSVMPRMPSWNKRRYLAA